MHTVNHAAVGAGIALAVQNPLVALPAAFLSHFVLDALPHYGIPGEEGYADLFKRFRTFVMVMADVVGVLLLMIILRGQPLYVYLAMVAAASPDLVWVYRYLRYERQGKIVPVPGLLTRFHIWIQWAERPWGIFIELPVAALLLYAIWRAV